MASSSLFANSERTCSALIFNCCQFSCCIPQNVLYGVSAPDESADWMGKLVDADPTIPLRQLVMPGTHDSASYSIAGWKPFSAVGRTQNLSVSDQLKSGIRYLDLRYAGASKDNTKLSIWHGCLEGGDLESILQEINAFLEEHPKEFLLLELVPEYGRALSVEQKGIFLKLVQQVLGTKIYPGREVGDLLQRVTLGELHDQKRQVAVLLHSRFYENEYTVLTEEQIADEYGFVTSQKWMRNRWHNTRENQTLLDRNLEEQERCAKDDAPHLWLTSQFVLTPSFGGPTEILPTLLGQNSLQPLALASGLYKPRVLDGFFREHADKPWNIVMLDYIDKCPLLMEFLIALNFPRALTVQRAVLGSGQDVTAKVRSHVARKRVLLLTNIVTDLDAESTGGSLLLAYQLGGAYYVATLDFDGDSHLLVSDFYTTDLPSNLKLQRGKSGFVAGGTVHTEKPSEGAAIEFKATDDGFEFPK